jgi:hypothetical protein
MGAAAGNNCLEVVDLTGGKVTNSLTGFNQTQDALFGDFNKLSRLDCPMRFPGAGNFWLIRDFEVEPRPTSFTSARAGIMQNSVRMKA